MSESNTCEWAQDDDSWGTQCGGEFVIIEGTPEDNGMNFCPYCGGRLVVTEELT